MRARLRRLSKQLKKEISWGDLMQIIIAVLALVAQLLVIGV